MNSRTRKWIIGAALPPVLTVAALAVSAQGGHASSGRQSDGPSSLVGTWNVQVTVRNCQTGAPLGNAFPTMASFADGGTMSSVDTGFNPALRSPSLGVWHHTTAHSYRATSQAFLFTASGAWNGTQRITQTIELLGDGDEFEGTAAVSVFDTQGNTILTGCSTSTARRLEE